MSLLTVVALGLLWVIVALGCWLGYQLLRQNGRIVLRLEALEEQLPQLLPPEPDGLPLGEAAPDFELPNLAGGRTAMSQFRGQRVLLIDLRMDYTAVGQTTHLAARMEQVAPPGTVRLTGEAVRLAEGYVEVAMINALIRRLTRHIERAFEIGIQCGNVPFPHPSQEDGA